MGETKAQALEHTLVEEFGINREHAEFHNAYQAQDIRNDIRFLKAIYGERMSLSPEDVTDDFLRDLKSLGKRLYFFILGLTDHVTPSSYIKHKFNFLKGAVPGGDPHVFYLVWNGLLGNMRDTLAEHFDKLNVRGLLPTLEDAQKVRCAYLRTANRERSSDLYCWEVSQVGVCRP